MMHQRSLLRARCLLLSLLSLAAGPATAGPATAAPRPIVAVFDIDSGSLGLPEVSTQSLTDFLAARLTATGLFRTVPRSQVRQRLTQLKVDSYKDCYDQACQIELGRELAAQSSLSAKVLKVEEACVLTLELFDLTSAISEAAATARGGCGESELFQIIISAVDALASKRAPDAPAARESTGAPRTAFVEPRKVSVTFTSKPPGANVLLDGLHRGVTPVRLAMVANRPVEMTLEREGYESERQTLVAKDALTVHRSLRLTPEERINLAATSEWFRLGMGPAYLAGAQDSAFSTIIGLANIKTRWFFWTLFEFNPLIVPSGASNYEAPEQDSLRLLSVTPGLEYIYMASNGSAQIGGGIQALVPLVGQGEERRPYQLMAMLRCGFSLSPVLRDHARRQRSPTGGSGATAVALPHPED